MKAIEVYLGKGQIIMDVKQHIYSEEIEYPEDALKRIFTFSKMVEPFAHENAADFGCGPSRVLSRYFPAIYSYDYFVNDVNIKFLWLGFSKLKIISFLIT